MRIKTTLFSLLVLSITSAIAQSQTSYSLEDAIKYAYNNNVTIKNAMLNIQDADQQIIERRAIGIPQINGELSYQYYPQKPISVLPEELAIDPSTGMPLPEEAREVTFVLSNNFTAGVSLSSLVFDGSYFVGLRAARLYRIYVQKELLNKQTEVKNQVTEAYLPVLLVDESLKLLEKNSTNLSTLLKETKALYKEGFVEQLDVDRLELSLANLKTEKENLERQRAMVINGLKLAMGYPQEQEIKITESIENLLIEASNNELSASVDYSKRSEYEMAELGLQLNSMNVDLYRAAYLPNMAVFANYQQAYFGDDFSSGFWAPTFVVGAQVNIPIFDGFEKKAKIQRAKIQFETAQHQKSMLQEVIQLEIKNARIAYLNAKQRVNAQQKNVQLAERIYNTTQIKYKEGVGSSLELTQAEQSLFQTQSNYTEALYNLVQAKMNLNKAIGNN